MPGATPVARPDIVYARIDIFFPYTSLNRHLAKLDTSTPFRLEPQFILFSFPKSLVNCETPGLTQ